MDKKLTAWIEASNSKKKIDELKETLGAWDRSESPNETVQQNRMAFRKSMKRHNRSSRPLEADRNSHQEENYPWTKKLNRM